MRGLLLTYLIGPSDLLCSVVCDSCYYLHSFLLPWNAMANRDIWHRIGDQLAAIKAFNFFFRSYSTLCTVLDNLAWIRQNTTEIAAQYCLFLRTKFYQTSLHYCNFRDLIELLIEISSTASENSLAASQCIIEIFLIFVRNITDNILSVTGFYDIRPRHLIHVSLDFFRSIIEKRTTYQSPIILSNLAPGGGRSNITRANSIHC